MPRPSTPRSQRVLLDREVNGHCPICGNTRLVRAHTTKTYSEVGYDINYMLSICDTCEKRVEKGEISRLYLQKIKRFVKLCISENHRGVNSYCVPLDLISNNIQLGNTLISGTNIIISASNYPMIWTEIYKGIRVLNARFYDQNGTVVTAINRNIWTSERERFYKIEISKIANGCSLKIVSKKDDTKIELVCLPERLKIKNSKFYTPNGEVEILDDGSLLLNKSIILNNISISGCAVAIGV
jgi:hypothetical protein